MTLVTGSARRAAVNVRWALAEELVMQADSSSHVEHRSISPAMLAMARPGFGWSDAIRRSLVIDEAIRAGIAMTACSILVIATVWLAGLAFSFGVG